jgi:hypothetical protein
MALAERERYRHYLEAAAAAAPTKADPRCLLAVLRFSAPVPTWLLKQLAQIRRVESTAVGVMVGGDLLSPDAYLRVTRGGRSVWVDPAEHQFGAAARASRKESIERRLASLDRELTQVAEQQRAVGRQLTAAVEAGKGHRAAEELARYSEDFAQARLRLPALRQARVEASRRWQELDDAHKRAVIAQTQAEAAYRETQNKLLESERAAEKFQREWKERDEVQRSRAAESHAARRRFPPRWIAPEKLEELRRHYTNATQARLRQEAIEGDLANGQWETDATVEEKATLMRAAVAGQQGDLEQRKASNEAARIAVGNARERYIDVLRATVRRYRKNIVDLGQLAGVEVTADLPHLDNDDTVLRQAELKVSFDFDGKGQIGLNDGEASGGQQVIKSLILLVGLMKDDETPGGFVFIDEPFAHLDVRNIQLVGHFLRSTRAQYVLTTPITHNVEVFEPADITLVTAKKPKGSRWAPPIGVLQRRAPSDAYA